VAKILFVIANRYANQGYLVELVQSNLRDNDCTIWSNTPVSEDLLQTGATVIGSGFAKTYLERSKTRPTGFGKVLLFPVLTLKVLHKMLWSPLTCAWRLNHGKFRVGDSSFDVIMAADAQAILSIWAFGRKHTKPQLISVKKVISST
jgi:hypothetical protein